MYSVGILITTQIEHTSHDVPLYPTGHLHTSTLVDRSPPVSISMAVSKLTSLRYVLLV